jgi:hypothetical protein
MVGRVDSAPRPEDGDVTDASSIEPESLSLLE